MDNPVQEINPGLRFQKIIPGMSEESLVNRFQETIEWNNILVGEHNFFIKIIDGKGNTVSEKQIPFSIKEDVKQEEEIEIIEPEENEREIVIIEVIEEEIANEVVDVDNVNRTVIIVDEKEANEVEAKEVEGRQLEGTESEIALMVMLPISIMIGVSLGILLIRKKLNVQ